MVAGMLQAGAASITNGFGGPLAGQRTTTQPNTVQGSNMTASHLSTAVGKRFSRMQAVKIGIEAYKSRKAITLADALFEIDQMFLRLSINKVIAEL